MSNILLVDMDGCLCDTMGAVFDRAEQEHGIQMTHSDIHDYWFNDAPLEKHMIFDYLREPGFYRNLDVITGAVRAVNRLRGQYDVVVCSQPMQGAESCEDEKREWLAEHFDTDFAESAIITRDKAKVMGKFIIEDNPFIDVPYGVIMFDQRWNRNRINTPRMYGWHDLSVVDRAMK